MYRRCIVYSLRMIVSVFQRGGKWREGMETREGLCMPTRSVNPGYGPEQIRLNQNYSRCIDNINVLNTKTLRSSGYMASPLVPDLHRELCPWTPELPLSAIASLSRITTHWADLLIFLGQLTCGTAHLSQAYHQSFFLFLAVFFALARHERFAGVDELAVTALHVTALHHVVRFSLFEVHAILMLIHVKLETIA